MAETIHVVLTFYGDEFGWGVTSPQLPELVGGALEYDVLLAEVPSLVEFGGGHPAASIEIHRQDYRILEDGREFTIRTALNRDSERVVVGQRLIAAMKEADQLDGLMTSPTGPMGEIVFVCALPDDTLEWVVGQMDDRSPAIIVVPIDAEKIFSIPIVHDPSPPPGTTSLADRGLATTSTVGELVASAIAFTDARQLVSV